MEKKIAVCINNLEYETDLTIDREHEVEVDDVYNKEIYYCIGDRGVRCGGYRTRFKIKEQTMNIQEEIEKIEKEFSEKLANLKELARKQKIPQFKENDWIVVGNPANNLLKVRYISGDVIYAKESYTSKGACYSNKDTACVNGWRLASNSEIETILISVAKKKGFVEGNYFKSINKGEIGRVRKITPYHNNHKTIEWIFTSRSDLYCNNGMNTENGKYCSNPSIYINGIWAEIVKEETFPTILGFKPIVYENEINYGCKIYTKEQINQLYSSLKIFRIEKFSIPEGEIKSSEIEQIIKAYED